MVTTKTIEQCIISKHTPTFTYHFTNSENECGFMFPTTKLQTK